ncbi:unnamed protein product [Paramecium sonneborni]|uniref:Uncharacterized protein n=1 Tax=Paramecium sonneborni TaxID=65129 RepID=A0A8S1R0B0_9CILI|nr:unnamed protein product [Paramecium sonneborni]
MKSFEIELDLDAEHIMWMYHLRYFVHYKKKYDTFIKFKGSKAFLKGEDLHRVQCAVQDAVIKAKHEFIYDFLMQSNNPDENYGPYMDLLSNQEYENMKKQYSGLFIFSKRQFMQIKQDLNDKFGYIVNLSRQYPLNYVIIFLPSSKQSLLIQRIQDLVQQINNNIDQGITPYNSQYYSYRNRDLANRNIFRKVYQIKMRDEQAIQIFLIFDIRRMEEYFKASFSLKDYGDYVIFVIQGSSDSGCQEVISTLENHLKHKILSQIENEQRDFQEMNMKIVKIEEIESIANRLDQCFGTEILKRVTNKFSKSNFIFTDAELFNFIRQKQMNEDINQISRITNSNFQSEVAKQIDSLLISEDISGIQLNKQKDLKENLQYEYLNNNDSEIVIPIKQQIGQQEINQYDSIQMEEEEEQQDMKQLKTIKDHKIETLKDKIIVEFFNYKEKSKFYLFQNNFDEELFYSDFDVYCTENYNLPHVIQPDSSEQNQLKFIIEIFSNEFKNNIVEITDFLDHYMNCQVMLGIKNAKQLKHEEFEELCDDFNCSFQIYNCDLNPKQIGWSKNEAMPQKSEKGKDVAIIFSNIMHCFIGQLQEKVNSLNQLAKKSIITLLFQSQFEYAYDLCEIKKLDLYCQFNFDDCYWVQITANNPKEIIEKIKEDDSKILQQTLSKQPVCQNEAIILAKGLQERDFYDVFIPELYCKYYEKLRRDYLNKQFTEEEWKNVKIEPDEKLFVVDVTDLGVQPTHLEPIIEVLASLNKKGKVIENTNDLQQGVYLIGRSRNVNSDSFELIINNHIIRYVYQSNLYQLHNKYQMINIYNYYHQLCILTIKYGPFCGKI